MVEGLQPLEKVHLGVKMAMRFSGPKATAVHCSVLGCVTCGAVIYPQHEGHWSLISSTFSNSYDTQVSCILLMGLGWGNVGKNEVFSPGKSRWGHQRNPLSPAAECRESPGAWESCLVPATP